MRRFTVIAITVCTTLAVTAAAVCIAFDAVSTDDGILLLTRKQAAECEDGGGCRVYSVREMQHVIIGVLGKLRGGHQPAEI